jgi:hypothetical protein
MNKQTLDQVKIGSRTYYYQALPEVREDGVSGTLVGYRKAGRDYWY